MYFMDPTLDKSKLHAISSTTRTKILKALKERRKTLSELSFELKYAPSTMSDHLRILVKSGLIKKVEEGHKWKYYELTLLGKSIGSPEIKWYVLFGISALVITSGFFWIFGYYVATPQYFAATIDKAVESSAAVMEGGASAALINFQMPPFPYLAIVLIAIGIAGFLITKIFYEKSKKKVKKSVKRRKRHGKTKRT